MGSRVVAALFRVQAEREARGSLGDLSGSCLTLRLDSLVLQKLSFVRSHSRQDDVARNRDFGFYGNPI